MVTPRTKIFAARLLISLLMMMIGTVALAAGGFPQTQDREDLLAATTGEKAVSASGYDFFLVTDNASHTSYPEPLPFYLLSNESGAWADAFRWASSYYFDGHIWGLDATEVYTGGFINPSTNSSYLEYFPGPNIRAAYPMFGLDIGGTQGFDRNDLFVVGGEATRTVLFHFADESLEEMGAVGRGHLSELWGLSPTDLFMAGSGGVIAWYNGTDIEILRDGPGGTIRALWGTGHANVYAGGDGGLLLRYDGVEWVQETIPIETNIYDIWGSGPDNIYAVGTSGTILHWNGVEWLDETTANANLLRGVYGSSADEVYAVGMGGAILHWNGVEWIDESLTANFHHWGIWGGLRNAGDQYWSAQYGNPAEGGSGTDSSVRSLLAYDGGVAVGGGFLNAGPDTMNHLGLWNGNSWSYLYESSGPNANVFDLIMYDGELIAAGSFSEIDGTPINCVAAYDGTSWRQLGDGLPAPVVDGVRKLVLWDGNLVALGDADCNAYWNSVDGWTMLPGVTGQLYACGVFDNVLYAAGRISAPGTAILQLDAEDVWTPFFGNFGTDPLITCFYEFEGQPLVGGLFNTIDGNPVHNLALFTGAAWVPFGGAEGTNGEVSYIGDYDGQLFLGGYFSRVGSVPVTRCALWAGETIDDSAGWVPMGSGLGGTGVAAPITDALEFGGRYLISGSFGSTGNHHAFNLASWNRSELSVSAPVSGAVEPTVDNVVEIQVEGNPEVYPVLLHYRSADGEAFQTSRMYQTAAKDGLFQGSVPGNMIGALGFQYYITAGGGGEIANYPPGDPDDPGYLPSFTGVTFTDDPLLAPPANQYIMMGVPFNPVQTTGTILTGAFGPYDKSKYRFGRWNPGTSKYDEYPNMESFAPGRGYWLIQKNPKDMPAIGVSTSTVGGITIDLLSGWNMISNPYNFPVDWSSVTPGANVEDRLVARAGGIYTDVAVMNPWQGYWVLNTSGPLTTINIPPTPAVVKKDGDEEPLTAGKIWEIVFDADMGEGDTYRADQRNVAGVWTQATAGVDKMDFHEVPAMPGDVRVFFEREQDGKVHDLSTDRRAPFTEGASWDLVVRTEGRAKVNLSMTGVADVPSEFAVILITETGQINLREVDSAIVLVGEGGETRLRLAVGDPQFVAEQEQNLPRPFALRPNYPNPFNPMTKLTFTLPRDSRVVIDIFDLRGRRVQRLVDDSFGPGLHEVNWVGRDDSGREVSAGVYFSRMRSEGFEQTRKMTLVR